MSFEDDVSLGNRGNETRHASACCFRDTQAKIDRGHVINYTDFYMLCNGGPPASRISSEIPSTRSLRILS